MLCFLNKVFFFYLSSSTNNEREVEASPCSQEMIEVSTKMYHDIKVTVLMFMHVDLVFRKFASRVLRGSLNYYMHSLFLFDTEDHTFACRSHSTILGTRLWGEVGQIVVLIYIILGFVMHARENLTEIYPRDAFGQLILQCNICFFQVYVKTAQCCGSFQQ